MTDPTQAIQALAASGHYVAAVIRKIETYDYVSFVEIAHLLAPYIPLAGDRAVAHPDDHHIILWAGMSPEFHQVITDLMATEQVGCESTNPLTYLIDGQGLPWPLAQRPPKGGYKTLHWLPICFRTRTKILATEQRQRPQRKAVV